MSENKGNIKPELTDYRLMPIKLLDNLISQIYLANKEAFDTYFELIKVIQQNITIGKPKIQDDETSKEEVIELDNIESNDKSNS